MDRINPWLWEGCNLFSRWLLTPLKLALRVRTEGEPPKPESGVGVLLAAKHVSSFDISVLADLAKRLAGRRPYYQMGSFVGYRILGSITPFLRRLGGFAVMRPKDLRRLVAKAGLTREQAIATMREVNQSAEARRQELLRAGEILVVYPEGTRSPDAVLPLKATTEIDSALTVLREGGRVLIWPVVLSFAPSQRWRRPADFHFLRPFELTKEHSAEEVLATLEGLFHAHWIPPDRMRAKRAD